MCRSSPTTPPTNLTAARELGINTALTPSGNVLWSPRLGVNYDLSGRGTTVLRGGVGLFAGRPPYVWFRNVYRTNGIQTLGLECFGDAVPEFTLDPGNQPDRMRRAVDDGGLLPPTSTPIFVFPRP